MMGNHSLDALSCANGPLTSHTAVEEVVYGYILPFICGLGFFGSIANITALKNRHLKAPSYTYMSNLATFQLIATMAHAGLAVGRGHYGGSIWTELYSTYIYWPVISCTSSLSLVLVVTMALDRYISFCKRTSIVKDQRRGVRSAKFVCVTVCLITAVVNLPHMFGSTFNWTTNCQTFELPTTGDGWFAMYLLARLLILNICFNMEMVLLYVLLIRMLRRTSPRALRALSPMSSFIVTHTTNHSRMLTVNMVGIMSLMFVGEIPTAILAATNAVYAWTVNADEREPYPILAMIAFSLTIVESSGMFAVNFLLNKYLRQSAGRQLKRSPTETGFVKSSISGETYATTKDVVYLKRSDTRDTTNNAELLSQV